MSTQTQTARNDGNSRPLKDKNTMPANASLSPSGMRCPDPSAHKTKNNSLQDQASAAALYGTNSPKGASVRDIDPLGPDGKLSSASAATSLKYARAHELPGFSVVGIDAQQSAGTAANLAHANKQSPEWWKPEQSAAAGKAALLAHDFKMAPLWQPEANAAGSKAAMVAHRDGVKLSIWMPEASADGNSAATLAWKKQGLSPEPKSGRIEDSRKKALVAATGAVSSSGRRRAHSTPTTPPLFPDSENSARNALNAATIAHTPSMRARKSPLSPPLSSDSNRLGSTAMEAARIQHSKRISRDMYTEHPPIALEVEEKKHQDALRASAISMAKQIYDVQQQHIDTTAGRSSQSHAKTGATAAHSQQPATSEADIKQQAMRYINIQEAAQKLASERLAKIGTDENAAFRSYYGYNKPIRSKLSIRRGRRRAHSNPETTNSDDGELQSGRIRSQMSQLNKTLAEVDAKKRGQDRKNLLAAAERKVHAQMQGLDKKIYDETGKMSLAMIEEWDAKARAKAVADSEARMEHHGKVHIGHGIFMDQADIDAVALARIQPTLDEINEKTEKRKAEEEEARLDQEEKKRKAQIDKERAAELRAEEKRAKDEAKKTAKSRTAEEKAVARKEQGAQKEKRAEEKRIQKEERRKLKEPPKTGAVIPTGLASPTDDAPAENHHDELYRDPPLPTQQVPRAQEPGASNPTSPTSPTCPTSLMSPTKANAKGIKSFLNKFKRRSRHSNATADTNKPGFIGGAALRASSAHSHRNSVPASPRLSYTAGLTHIPDQRRYSSVSSVSSSPASFDGRGRTPQRTASGLSAVSTGTEYEEARDEFDEKLVSPPSFASSGMHAARKGNSNRDSKFYEMGI
ncbi:uncharacterized protein BDR25DRAFT_340314 [Lindgomyces ingoldianus]|uniref:Uncharacterized protein n=1 Tax=Lindgomyces ingoldianus TaxID=673940 RepID=A0ACB6R5E5_9PLEO|nr:uncharacterized protein BDR25DRAFT_340314 [Lindgomyces ingoldianus]KAF2474498.1 hypothetical protein BDR25DRAFT_340314 [Lindgomyces ingoldianus]